VTLRLEPHAIPALRKAIDDVLGQLTPHLTLMGQDRYIPGPWLGDPDSAALVEFYNRQVMDAPDGPYHALLAYRDHLEAARDHLAHIEADYRRVDGDNADLWGQLR